jgi:cell cycle arrest protein BUB3
VRLYEIDDCGGHKTEAKAKFDHRAAVLACSFSADGTHAFSGGLDTVVKEYVDEFFTVHIPSSCYLFRLDLTTEKVNSLGLHDDSISSMTFVRSTSKASFFENFPFFSAAVILKQYSVCSR